MARYDDDDDDDDRPAPKKKKKKKAGTVKPKKRNATPWIIGGILGVVFLVVGGIGFVVISRMMSKDKGNGSTTDTKGQGDTSTKVDMSLRNNTNWTRSSGNMKQILLAYHMYHDSNANSVVGNSYTADGTPLLSWRVHLLPHLGQQGLYQQFKLDEPWDGPNNKRLVSQMPEVFISPWRQRPGASTTHYRGFSHPGAVLARFPPKFGQTDTVRPLGPAIFSFVDQRSDTIFIVDADDPVEWTKPEDLDGSDGKPLPFWSEADAKTKVLNVITLDGFTHTVTRAGNEVLLRRAFTHSGREPFQWP